MKKLILSVSLLISCVLSCTAQEFISTNGSDPRRHHVSNATERRVMVYMDSTEVPSGLKRVGIITSSVKGRTKAFERSKHVAAMYGCNAMLLVQGKEVAGGGRLANTVLGVNAFKGSWVFYAYRAKIDPTND